MNRFINFALRDHSSEKDFQACFQNIAILGFMNLDMLYDAAFQAPKIAKGEHFL